jgi:preprotein translocase subunit SecG
MHTPLMIFQAVLSLLLIIIVLLQFGKGAEVGLMGGASDAVFSGGQRGNFFTRATAFIALLFLGNSILLAKFQSSKSAKSILDNEAPIARPLNNDAEQKKSEAAAKAVETSSNAKDLAAPAASNTATTSEKKK